MLFIPMSPDQMMHYGAWMIFFCLIFLLILVTLAIAETIVQRRLDKRCTAIANGTYAGIETVKLGTGRHKNATTYDLAKFYANGQNVTARLGMARGINLKTATGTPLVVHYNPDHPTDCWANTPGTETKPTMWRTVFRWCTIVTFVLAIILIAFSYPASGLPLSEFPSTVFAHI